MVYIATSSTESVTHGWRGGRVAAARDQLRREIIGENREIADVAVFSAEKAATPFCYI
jgi:hypothetical protein